MTAPLTYQLSALELACGLVFGAGDGARPLPETDLSPLAAFEAAVRTALERPPCLVSFSGGRDSSTVLTLATRVARREGLLDPIPATNCFPDVETADESAWQERVVSSLGLADWFRYRVQGELDCVGPIATETLRRHGLLWPFNAYFHVPLIRAARGGALLTGVFGDEVLGASRWARASAVMSGRTWPRPRDVLRVGFALAPRPVRRSVIRRRLDVGFPWLRPASERLAIEAFAAEEATEPIGWEAGLQWWLGLRHSQVAEESLAVLATDENVRLVHPFADRGFMAALAQLPRQLRFGSRSDGLRQIFGGHVDPGLLGRTTKASFDGAFFGSHSRAFTAAWDGAGLDPTHVDVGALREHWRSGSPDGRSFLLVQAAWLAAEGSCASTQELRHAV